MTVAAVLGLLVVHNLVTNLWASERWYVTGNLLTAGVLVALAGQGDIRRSEIGLTLAGAPAAVAGALVVLVALALATAVPRIRPLLADRRMAGVDARGTAWRALVRIPLGTVVLEEVAFRGVLPSLLSPVVASVLFGLWHVLPTATALETNDLARSRRNRALAVAGAVAVTTAVGLVLWELRAATGGLLTPALVHAAANGGAVVAAFVVLRPRYRRGTSAVPAAELLPDVAPEQAVQQPS